MRQVLPEVPSRPHPPAEGDLVLIVLEAVERSLSKEGYIKYYWFKKVQDG